MLKSSTLAGTLLLLLSACGGGGGTPPTTPKIPGATVQLQLSEKYYSLLWTLGAAQVEFTEFAGQVDMANGPVIATAQSNAAGAASLVLPGEAEGILTRATQPVTTLFSIPLCKFDLKSSNPDAKGLIGSTFSFTTSEGGGKARAFSGPVKNITEYDLVFSSQATTLSGSVTCLIPTPTPQSFNLAAGWNLVARNGLVLNTLPLSTPIQVTRL